MGGLSSGMDANNRGDHATALREWQPLAKQGHAIAQYNLGLLYANGQGVPKTMSKRGSGTRKPPLKDTPTARSTWGACMTMDGVFRRISRWL